MYCLVNVLMNVCVCLLPAETVSELSAVLPERLLQLSSVGIKCPDVLLQLAALLLALWKLKQGGTEEQVSFTEEVMQTLGLHVCLHVLLAVFNLKHTR